MLQWTYTALLLACFSYVFWKGRFDERFVAVIMLVGSFSTALIYHLTTQDWLQLNVALLVNELVLTALILFVAYRSDKYWPLLVAAFQMLALLTPITKLFGGDLNSYGLGITQGMWAYLQLATLTIATWTGRHRNPV